MVAHDQEKVSKLQMMEHNLQALDQQRQQMQAQLFEIDSALSALEGSTTAYRIVGSVMVNAQPADVRKELQQRKELMEVRLQSIEKQEEKLRSSAKDLQDDVMHALKGNK